MYSFTFFLLALVAIVVKGAPQLFRDQEYIPEDAELVRTRRGSQGAYGHLAPSYDYGHGAAENRGGYAHGHGTGHGHGHGYGHGHRQPVGPVFTYVRTDYHGNFQWGVRHKAGGNRHYGR